MKLLVSPLNIGEAKAAVRGGADIIDVKNPAEGSLGANFPWVVKEIMNVLPESVELSATIGDLDFKPGTASLAAYGLAQLGVDYVKAGLFGIKNDTQAEEIASKIAKAVEGTDTKVVLAGYADYKEINSISPFKLPAIAAKVGVFGVMIDTAFKKNKGLFDHASLKKLKDFVKDSHELGLSVALAGSLKTEHVVKLREINPDIVGVRGLVCNGDRISGRVSEEKVKKLKELLASRKV